MGSFESVPRLLSFIFGSRTHCLLFPLSEFPGDEVNQKELKPGDANNEKESAEAEDTTEHAQDLGSDTQDPHQSQPWWQVSITPVLGRRGGQGQTDLQGLGSVRIANCCALRQNGSH